MPIENGEGLQLLRYRNGEKFDAHHDWSPSVAMDGGPRTATMLIYLCVTLLCELGELYDPRHTF